MADDNAQNDVNEKETKDEKPENQENQQEAPKKEASASDEAKKDEPSEQPDSKVEETKPEPEPKAEPKADKAPKTESEAAEEIPQVPKEFEKLVEQLDKLSALQISQFVQFLEKYWGVSAAAPATEVVASPAGGDGGAPAADEKSEYDVTLKDPGAQKVAVIKAVKEITGLGLGEAKAIVDSAPKAVKEKVSKDEAEEAKKALEEAGATVEVS